MKSVFPGFCALACLAFAACQSSVANQAASAPPPPGQQRAADSAAIMKALETETRNFYLKDHGAWAGSYARQASVHWVCVEEDVTLRADGWDDLSQFVSTWMKDNPEPMDYDKSEFKHSDVRLALSDSLAFVSFKSSNLMPDGRTRRTINSRTLLRQPGGWKLLSMTSYPSDRPRNSSANVYLHGKP